MEIRAKLYPYPVLAEFLTDYKTSSFTTVINIEKDAYNPVIDFTSNVTNKEIKELITNHKASYAYHIECPQTSFRTVIKTSESNYKYTLSYKMIKGKVQICPFIVAEENVYNFTSTDLDDDYKGIIFNLEEGSIFAVGKQINLCIEDDVDDFSNAPSIFCIIPNADKSKQYMTVDYEGQKITIILPFYDYVNYKAINNNSIYFSLLHSITLIPALVYVIEEIIKIYAPDREELEKYKWYKSLKNTLKTKHKIDLNDSNLEDKINNPVELAFKLINNPLSNALSLLSSYDDNTSSEE